MHHAHLIRIRHSTKQTNEKKIQFENRTSFPFGVYRLCSCQQLRRTLAYTHTQRLYNSIYLLYNQTDAICMTVLDYV